MASSTTNQASAVLDDSATPSLPPNESSAATDGASADQSIQSSFHQRRESIEKGLQTRPTPQELKDRNILYDTSAAPALQQAKHDLERQIASDSLKKHLSQRPERSELVDRNILPESNVAPALQGHAKELEKQMRMDTLETKIANRPSPEDLVKEGIMSEEENPLKQ